jgi:hypothetical protein
MGQVIKILFILSLLFLPLQSFSAETVKLKYLQSVYFDEKGGGFRQPEGVACNEKSVLVIGDTGNDRLLRYAFQEKRIGLGTEIKIPELSNPLRVQMNSKGNLCLGW